MGAGLAQRNKQGRLLCSAMNRVAAPARDVQPVVLCHMSTPLLCCFPVSLYCPYHMKLKKDAKNYTKLLWI